MRDAPRLGEYLVAEGLLRPDVVHKALETQNLLGGRLGTNLLEHGGVSEDTLLDALGHLRSTRTVRADELRNVSPEVLRMIPAKLAQRHKLVPFRVQGRTLFVASKDPGDALREDEIAFLTSYMVRTCIALELRLEVALRRHYGIRVDDRFLILRRRLLRAAPSATEQTSARASEDATPSAGPAASPSAMPAPPPAAAPTPAPPVSTPAETPPVSTPAETPPVSTPAETPVTSAPAAPEGPAFIELDAEDLASLRRPSEPSDEVPGDTIGLPLADAAGVEEPVVDDDFAPLETAAAPAVEALDDEDLDIEGRLHHAARILQEAEIRDEIGDALLAFASHYFRRRALLIRRRERIFGWTGDGEGVTEASVRSVDLEDSKPSVFLGLTEPSSFWLGPLPPLPSNQALMRGLAGVGEGEKVQAPKDCVVLPVTLRGKVVCYFYADNLDQGVGGAPVAELKRLVAKAGLAFEVYILKHKIRVL